MTLWQVMHPDCHMVVVSGEHYSNTSMHDDFDVVANRASPSDVGEPRRDTIRTIEIIRDETATVRLQCRELGKICEDSLTLIHDGHRWSIISKVFAYRVA